MSRTVAIVVDPSVRARLPAHTATRLRAWMARALEAAGARGQVSLRLCDDAAIRRLNHTYRKITRIT